ncbi:hypothetical protein [Nonomuraea salmonea]|uniref:hypothetical protein n=1 Tax=Nonomuraea salmonea TaxID=46181 RepID=UPI0031EAF12C
MLASRYARRRHVRAAAAGPPGADRGGGAVLLTLAYVAMGAASFVLVAKEFG